MAFGLLKSPCRRVRVLDEDQVPPDGEEHSLTDYPEYYDALYSPEYHEEVFESSEAVRCWLGDIFAAESGWPDIKVSFDDGNFMVDDASCDIRIFLSLEDIAKESFHPRTYYKLSYPTLRSNPFWLYRSEAELKHSFEGITVKQMGQVIGDWQKVKRRDNAIEAVVEIFRSLARRVVRMSDQDLFLLCKEKNLGDCPEINGRRWMYFEIFRATFGDRLFPRMIRLPTYAYPKVLRRGNGLLRSIDPELDVSTFSARARTLWTDIIKRTLDGLHYTRRKCSVRGH